MQKVKICQWNMSKKSFIKYDMNKLTLIYNLDMFSNNASFYLLISVTDCRVHSTIKEITNSLRVDSVYGSFL